MLGQEEQTMVDRMLQESTLLEIIEENDLSDYDVLHILFSLGHIKAPPYLEEYYNEIDYPEEED